MIVKLHFLFLDESTNLSRSQWKIWLTAKMNICSPHTDNADYCFFVTSIMLRSKMRTLLVFLTNRRHFDQQLSKFPTSFKIEFKKI